jgi:hypothetical protein
MTTLRTFLDDRRVKKGENWNLTGMSGDDIGSYYVANEDYNTFQTLYFQHVFVDRKPASLLERHGNLTPLLFDLDLHYPTGTVDRAFGSKEIQRFLSAYVAAFFHFFVYDKPLRFFVMLKPELVAEGAIVKDGIHIVCGDLTVDYAVPFVLRAYTLEKGILGCFSDRVNSDKNAFDESVIKRNNWFVYGSSKPGREAYTVDYCFLGHPDGRIEECDWIETDADLVRLCSLQVGREVPTVLPVRAEVLDEWKMWESIATVKEPVKKEKRKGTATASATATKDGDGGEDASVCSHLSDGITKILKLKGLAWDVSESEEGFKLDHNAMNCLVSEGVLHSTKGHSCVFVHRTHAVLSCFSHKTKKIPKGKAEALWLLLTSGEDMVDLPSAYEQRKAVFETAAFRVLNPPGYMTCIDGVWVHYTRQQLIDMNSGIFLDDAKKERFIDWWLRDEHIRTYSKTGYYVDISECPTTVFNTFSGFAAQAVHAVVEGGGDLSLVLWHIRHILAAGVEEVYEFLLDFLASCVQCPRRLTGICLVVLGAHGSGKDILFNWFGSKVIGMEAYFKTARPHIDMFGSFNSSRLNRVFYHIEEGNSKSFNGETVEQFKNFITDEFASIQLKGVNTGSNVTNYNHFVISSNNAVPFEIHPEERRFFAVRVSPEKVRNNEYFTRLLGDLGKPSVVRGLYDHLMSRDLTGRDWKNPPGTEAMREWKHSCESDLLQFLEYYKEMNPTIDEIMSSELYTEYRAYCRDFRRESMKLRQFGMEMKKAGNEIIHTRNGNAYKFGTGNTA